MAVDLYQDLWQRCEDIARERLCSDEDAGVDQDPLATFTSVVPDCRPNEVEAPRLSELSALQASLQSGKDSLKLINTKLLGPQLANRIW